ncbi:hypothetical protein [Luteimonas saliphila]|uniref:hypothetical protein n=1 Tax=Luteimonas saliphila TaxID=2804919 RepID=UPI00192D51D0|nr:hypothetical protein [Luteimonas saliphila]
MNDFDWDATCDRPLTRECVWTLMQAGCNAHEIAAAGGVSLVVALGLMHEAVPRPEAKPVLRMREAA